MHALLLLCQHVISVHVLFAVLLYCTMQVCHFIEQRAAEGTFQSIVISLKVASLRLQILAHHNLQNSFIFQVTLYKCAASLRWQLSVIRLLIRKVFLLLVLAPPHVENENLTGHVLREG
jgi:hypothetical protein